MSKKIINKPYDPERNRVNPEHYEQFKDLKPNTNPFYLFFKRAADIVCSFLALIVLSPVFLATAVAVRSDGGPVLFRQIRVGKGGKTFSMYKFRSMVVDADKMTENLKNDAGGPVFKMYDDPRVTRVGRFIRKYSIDELPQLINILKGDMSIVGPRPALPNEVAMYSDYAAQRLKVRPGLTCYWQCGGRSRISFDKWIDMDLEYINDQNLWRDFKIILKTIPAVFNADGAY